MKGKQDTQPKADRVYNSRWNHVYRLWKSLLSLKELPQLDVWLSNEFSKNKSYGSKDRRWYSDVLFGAMRHGYYALFCSVHLSSRGVHLSSRGLTAGSIPHSPNSIHEFSKKYDSLPEILDGLRNADPEIFFQHVTKRMEQDSASQPFSGSTLSEKLLFHSIPLWLEDHIQKRMEISSWDAQTLDQFLNQQDFRPPLWIRINHEQHQKNILDELNAEGFQTEIHGSAIQVTGTRGIYTLKSFQNGLFEIQDLASQQIGAQVQAKPGQYVWDCCAGGGGKSIQIASFLKNKGVIYASDIRAHKLLEIKKRAKKAQFFNIRCMEWDGTKNVNSFPKEIELHKGFDWVLVDAPCSSSGTWRRNPDAKYRISKEGIENLVSLQLSLLQQASLSVVQNGHLVYSTCSFLVEENEGVVSEFLKKNSSFQLVQKTLLGNPKENADTMFAAVFSKK